jgi:hypothetical protein
MAEVWEAIDHHPNPHSPDGRVAVKILKPEHAGKDNYVRRFKREGKTLDRLDHPNIVQVFETGSDGWHFLVMELLDGRAGDKLIEACAPIEPSMAVDIVAQLCDALQYIHRKKIFHRDIKPSNIMVMGGPGEPGPTIVKVTDFGIARAIGDTTITHHQGVVGTLLYMSPESLRGVRTETNTSDIYSAGVLLYQLLTSKLPYEASSLTELLARQERPPTPPHKQHTGIPQQLSAAVLCAMAYEPGLRFEDAASMSLAIVAASKGEDVSDLMPTKLRTQPTWFLPNAFRGDRQRMPERDPEEPLDVGRIIRVGLAGLLLLVGLFVCVRLLNVVVMLSPVALVASAGLIVAVFLLGWTKTGRRQVGSVASTLWLAIRPLGDDDHAQRDRAEAARASIRASSLRGLRLLLLFSLIGYWAFLTYHLAGEVQDAIERRPDGEQLLLRAGILVLWVLAGLGPLLAVAFSRTRVTRALILAFLVTVGWSVGAELLPKLPSAVGPLIWSNSNQEILEERVSSESGKWKAMLSKPAAGQASGPSPQRIMQAVRQNAHERQRSLRRARGRADRVIAKHRARQWVARMRRNRRRWRSPHCKQHPTHVGVDLRPWGVRVACF